MNLLKHFNQFFFVSACLFLTVLAAAAQTVAPKEPPFAIVIHGGAGVRERAQMTPELEREYRAVLNQSLAAGHEILKRGGNSLDAIEAAIRVM